MAQEDWPRPGLSSASPAEAPGTARSMAERKLPALGAQGKARVSQETFEGREVVVMRKELSEWLGRATDLELHTGAK